MQVLEDFWKLIKAFWINPKDFFSKYALPLFFFVGVFLFTASHFEWFTGNDLWNNFLHTIGSAILIGGIFSATTKSAVFLNLFKTEIQGILLGEKFCKFSTEERNLKGWKSMTYVLYAKKYPELKGFEEAIEKYLPKEEIEYYYSKYVRRISVRWANEEEQLISIEDHLEATLTPAIGLKKVLFKVLFSTKYVEKTKLQTHKLLIDRKDHEDKVKIFDNGKKYGCEIFIDAKEQTLEEEHAIILPLKEDPIFELTTERFIMGMTIHVEVGPENLKPTFESIGVNGDFEDIDKGKSTLRNRDLHKKYRGLTLPNSGVIITFNKI